jgi:uncharacterized membrane protein
LQITILLLCAYDTPLAVHEQGEIEGELRGNSPKGNFRGGEYSGGEFSRGEFSEGNFRRGIFRGEFSEGNFQRGIFVKFNVRLTA